MAAPKLIIVDGHSLLYRAFFAVPPLSTRDGTPTNAVYGFLRMLLKLWREEGPDYLAIAFDAPTPTFRHQQFADYKAQRVKAPDAFRPQGGLLRQILKAAGIPFWELDGYEADDLMATAVAKARPMGVQVLLVTTDMDALQLVGDDVIVLMPKRGISEMERYDARRVLQEFGVPPERIPDLKGLAGDASDNLPGVPGIGEKTARELLQTFGSLESVLENADQIPKPQVRDNLIRFADQARRCKALATLKSDAPIDLNLDELAVHHWRWRSPEVAELLMRLEMRRLLEELGLTDLLAQEAFVRGTFIRDEGAWIETLQAIKQQGRVALALDGTERHPKGVALAWKGAVAYLPLTPQAGPTDTASLFAGEKERAETKAHGQALPDGKRWLLTLLTDVTLIKSAHNWKRLLKAIGPVAIERCGMTPRGFEDAEVLAYLLNPGQGDYPWKPLAMERRLPTKFRIAWDDDERVPTDACEEALTVIELAPLLVNEVREAGMWELWERIEMPLLFVLADMERHGVLVDVEYLRQLGEEMQRMARQLEEQIYRMAGVQFNLRSPQQLAEVLFRRLQLPIPKRMAGGRLSTAAPVLEALAKEHEIVRLILRFRELEKLRGTFVEGLIAAADEQGRVHTTYDQTGTATGRLASSEPNLQNIPVRGEWGKRVRRAFIAPKGYRLLSADYSQIELRILAHLSGDEGLCEAFERGEDIHTQTAASIFGVAPEAVTEEMRRKAKILNFGIVYGISPQGLAQQLNVTVEEAQEIIRRYFERFPKVRDYIDRTVAFAREHRFVRTLMNRRRLLPDIASNDPRLQESAQRAAINTPVQGTSADLIKAAMVAIWRSIKERGLDAKMTMQVHDELILEVAERQVMAVARLVKQRMETVFPLRVPLVVEVKVGDNWAEMERIL